MAGGNESNSRGSNYITPEGYERLRSEHQELWKVERPRVTHQVSVAAALGDRSENADYIYGKRRLREIDEPELAVIMGGEPINNINLA